MALLAKLALHTIAPPILAPGLIVGMWVLFIAAIVYFARAVAKAFVH